MVIDMNEEALKEDMEKKLWDLRFGVKKSYFYHEKRVLFWTTLLFISQGTEAVLTSTAAAFLFHDAGEVFSRWAVLISAILSFVAIWFGANKRVRTNMEKKAIYLDIENELPRNAGELSEEVFRRLKTKRLKVELTDDVVLPCVEALARNDACRALGLPEDRRLGIVEKTIGRILPIPYTKKIP